MGIILSNMGFYYNQPKGFYYNQQQGFYYDQQDGNFAQGWKKGDADNLRKAAVKQASAKVAAIMISNQHLPGPTENRILAQISAERIAYEAAEIWMNSTKGNDKLSTKEIQKQMFAICKKAIDPLPEKNTH